VEGGLELSLWNNSRSSVAQLSSSSIQERCFSRLGRRLQQSGAGHGPHGGFGLKKNGSEPALFSLPAWHASAFFLRKKVTIFRLAHFVLTPGAENVTGENRHASAFWLRFLMTDFFPAVFLRL